MASQQVIKDTKTGEKESKSEEPKVMKLAQQFEELATDQVKDPDKTTSEGVHHGEQGKETHATNVGGDEKGVGGKEARGRKEGTPAEKEGNKGEYPHTLDDIGMYRSQAQQNSMEAIRGAEERYAQAKQAVLSSRGGPAAGAGLSVQKDVEQPLVHGQGGAKDTDSHGGHASAMGGSSEKDVKQTEVHGQGGGEDTATRGGHAAVKGTTNEAAQQGSDYTTAAKETIVGVGKTAIDYTKHAAEQAKDVAVTKGAPAVHYIGEKVTEVGKIVAGYAGEKAVAAKDTTIGVGKTAAGATVDVGKSAAGYVGDKTVQAKDVALDTGLRATHYTLEKAVEATEATAGLGRRAVELTGEKADAAREEAIQKEQEAKERGDKTRKEAGEKKASQYEDTAKSDEYEGEAGTKSKPAKEGGSIVEAVGETVVEIAQTAKGLVTGDHPSQKM